MTQRRGRKYFLSRLFLLLAIGLAVSLTIAFAATYRGKQTGARLVGVLEQPNGGAWYVVHLFGPGFSRYESIYARDQAEGGEDTIQIYNKNYIFNFTSGYRTKLVILGDWGKPPVLPGRISSRLNPSPVEPSPMTEEDDDGSPVPENNWQSYLERMEAGWPMRCLSAEVVGPKVDNTYFMESKYRGAARLPHLRTGPFETDFVFGRLQGAIPYHPMPIGLAFNTLFWALVLWFIFLMPWQLRRWLRTRSGRCLVCGYDLSGAVSNICPECGGEHSLASA